MVRNVVRLSRPLWRSISSCSQDCAIHAISSFSPAASMHTVITATKLQRSWCSCSTRHCWLMWRCFASKKPCLACGMERRLWTARNPVSSHWPPHRTAAAYALAVTYRMQQHLFAVQPVICSLNTSHSVVECQAIGCSSCSMWSGAVGASMRSIAVTVA